MKTIEELQTQIEKNVKRINSLEDRRFYLEGEVHRAYDLFNQIDKSPDSPTIKRMIMDWKNQYNLDQEKQK